jgi:pantoate--beta-alanine ligase
MQIFMESGPLQAYTRQQKRQQLSIGLVPTMGALHAGHISLIDASRKANDLTVCSIFVNPTQFNNPTDLEKYPRTPDADLAMLSEAGCDVVFCPQVSTMYAQRSQMKLDFGQLDKILEGEFRPGHFSGVGLVVGKLFNIIQPDAAYFGQKDFQQFKVIETFVDELKFNVRLVCVPIVRENDGLAMSSRNKRLDEDGRRRAPVLYQCLQQMRLQLIAGTAFSIVEREAKETCKKNNIRLEYVALADDKDLSALETIEGSSNPVLLIAGYVDDVRLIDNLFI